VKKTANHKRSPQKLSKKTSFYLTIIFAFIFLTCLIVFLSLNNYHKAPNAATRDKYSWPFASNSIWNLPIGANAQYIPAGIQPAGAWGGEITTDDENIGLNPNDPLKPLNGAMVHIPPSMSADGSWNNATAFLQQDNNQVSQGQPLVLPAGGNPNYQYAAPTVDITSGLSGEDDASRAGAHGGSALSSFGGSIRKGELSASTPLHHALKVNLYAARFISCTSGGFRWPAFRADGYMNCTSYGGKVPQLRMGALLALNPNVDLSFITSVRARKIAEALRDYGAYVVDDTYWDVHAIDLEKGAEFSDGGSFHSDLQKVFSLLSVIDNWSQSQYTIVAQSNPQQGVGGGTPRVAWAPAIDGLVTYPTPSAVPTPSIAPTLQSGASWLSDLSWVQVTNGWGPVEKDTSNGEQAAGDGKPMSISGVKYAKGLGGHANSTVTFNMNGNCTNFTSDVGVDDETNNTGSIIFQIYADGALLFDSGVMRGGNAPKSLSVNVTGKQQLKLQINDDGDGFIADHGDWAGSSIVCVKPSIIGLGSPTPTPAATPAGGITCAQADFNSDKVVDLKDLELFRQHYDAKLGDPLYDPKYDLNKDGKIGFADIILFAKVFGQTC